MDKQVHIPETYVMRDFSSSPVARALRTAVRLFIRISCLGAFLYLAIPSNGPTIPVRTIPNYTRIGSLATLVSAPEPDSGFTEYVSWVTPPRFKWDFFAGLDDSPVFDLGLSDSDEELVQTVSVPDTPLPDTVAAAFFTADPFDPSGPDFTAPDGAFVLYGRGGPGPDDAGPTPEPQSFILFAIGLAALSLAARYRRSHV
jgi:hypothetical protein